MSLFFNAEEIFKIAVQIERNGKAFYQRAAELFDGEVKQRLMGLAAMEEIHEKFFTQLLESLFKSDSAAGFFDPDGDAERYLAALASDQIFDLDKKPEAFWSEKSSIGDILKLAIQREKESVIYYVGLKAIVPKDLGKEKIDDIIIEEMKHVTLLTQTLTDLQRLGKDAIR